MRAARPLSPATPSASPSPIEVRMPSGMASSTKVPVASEAPPPSEPPPRSRRFEDVPTSSRIPFGARVLVVDDDQGAGDELRGMLAEMGLVVDLAATTMNAEQRLKTEVFDAIVLDLHAAGSDSRGFVTKLRADDRFMDVPVLFLSSQPTSRDAVDAFASGGDDFLPKPFRTPELAARIFGLLRRARFARGALGSSGR